ncbi:MAG: STAS domain-containing protein [Prolixibacteraceae bacterium]
MLKTNYIKNENKLMCTFSGHISGLVCDELAAKIDSQLAQIKENGNNSDQLQVAFDLAEVSYIASSYIRICMATAKKLRPGNFSIINCNPFIKKTFKVAGLDEALNVV